MGKEIEQCLIQSGHTIAATIDNDEQRNNFSGSADVAVEFSTPQTVIDNLLWCFEKNIPVVTGTTGWLDQLPMITEQCEKMNGSLLWGSNFSIGMNVFFMLNKELTKFMNHFPQYKPSISEVHHVHKLDKPSGTAITLANDMIDEAANLHSWVLDKTDAEEGQLPVFVERIGEVKGTHDVKFESNEDIISIHHEAKSRKGFALGAIMAAQWIKDKKGVCSFPEFFKEIIGQ